LAVKLNSDAVAVASRTECFYIKSITLTFLKAIFILYDQLSRDWTGHMKPSAIIFASVITTLILPSCTGLNYFKGGIYSELDENLTIVGLMETPNKYLNREIVFSVRYYKKGKLPCPLGTDYVNFVIADRVSYITLNKVWIRSEKAKVLDTLKEMETVVMKARIFKVDREKDPNLEALEIVKE